jgi:methyl-accepting chemotaxis protein
MFGYISFRARILLGFGTVLVLMVAMASFSYLSNAKSEEALVGIDTATLPNALLASEMAQNVVQVQQFLTDVSATHNPGGYEEAEGYAKAFKQGLATFRQQAGNDAAQLKKLATLEQDFDQFYADGKRMADAYMNSGIEAGNQIMEQFDQSSVSLSTRMEALRDIEVKDATTHVHQLTETTKTVTLLVLGLAILSIMAGLGIAFYLTRYLSRQLGVDPLFAKGIAKEIANGDFNREIKLEPGDTQSLLHALKDMQQQLRERAEHDEVMQQQLRDRMEREAEEKESALRIQMALNKASANVMMADEDYNIIYVNEALVDMFAKAQNDLRKQFPHFDVNKLLGANMDFFKNPLHQRANLDNLRTTSKSGFVVGGRYLDWIANPVIDGAGCRIGTVVEWQDRTHEIEIENEIKGIVDAVKGGKLDRRLDTSDKSGFSQILSTNINDLTGVIENVFSDIANVMGSIAAGNLTQRITNHYEGVYDSCKDDINATVDTLRERIEREAQEKKSALRIQMALDKASTNVMMADANHNIIYVNEALTDLFRRAQNDFRTELLGFNVSALNGLNLDIFHQNPTLKRTVLDNMRTVTKSSFTVGGWHFDLVANPVIDDEGQRVGTVVEWQDRTHEIKIQNEIKAIVDAVKGGDLEKRLDTADKAGFFQVLSMTINDLTAVIENVFSDIAGIMGGMAGGDLSNRITNHYEGTYESCKDDINGTLDKLREVFSQIQDAATSISQSSDEIASGNNDLSNRAEQQAASLEQTASSMEELTGTVKHNADFAQQASLVANQARQLAEQGSQVAGSAIHAMQEINESNTRIGEIIGVIDEIALQTNILALNAAVEAARAGEQGRGFAVVAAEVRNLAQRSAEAAKEIKALIVDSVDKVEGGSKLVSEASKSLNEIVVGVKQMNTIIAQIASESEQQFQGIKHVNQAVAQMDDITQQNAALAEQAAAASVSMSDQTAHMRDLLAFFHLDSDVGSLGMQPKKRLDGPVKQHLIAANMGDDEQWEEF